METNETETKSETRDLKTPKFTAFVEGRLPNGRVILRIRDGSRDSKRRPLGPVVLYAYLLNPEDVAFAADPERDTDRKADTVNYVYELAAKRSGML